MLRNHVTGPDSGAPKIARRLSVMCIIVVATAQGQLERPQNASSGETRLTSWIILKRNLEMTVLLDTARIRWNSTDSSVDVWLRYATAKTTPMSYIKNAKRFQTLDIEAIVQCRMETVRTSTFVFYDSTGTVLAKLPIGAAAGAQSSMTSPVQTVLPLLCSWLSKTHLIR
jgi:hypothetical protein